MSTKKKKGPLPTPTETEARAEAEANTEAEAMIAEGQAAEPADEIPEVVQEILKMERQIAALDLPKKTQVRAAFVFVAVFLELGNAARAAGRFDEAGNPLVHTEDFWKAGIFPVLQAIAVELPQLGISQLDKVQEALAHFWTGGPLEAIEPPAEG